MVRGGYGIFYQQINGETTHAAEGPWRGNDAAASGADRRSVRLARTDRAAAGIAGPVRLLADLDVSRVCAARCIRCRFGIVYTDQNLRTSYTHHVSVSLQRQLTTQSRRSRASYIGKIGSKLVGHNYFNAAPFINSPITGQPPTLQNVEERVPFSPGIISAQSRVLGNFFRSEYHSLQLRVERRIARSFSFSGSYALSKN